MTRPLTALFALFLSSPALAGWHTDVRFDLGTSVSSEPQPAFQFGSSVAFGPRADGPQFDLVSAIDATGPVHQSQHGLGVRQSLSDELSVAGHVLWVRQWRRFPYDDRDLLGFEARADYDLHRGRLGAIGLHADLGIAPGPGRPPVGWAGAAIVFRFGSDLSQASEPGDSESGVRP